MIIKEEQINKIDHLLKGKTIIECKSYSDREFILEFSCGTKLFINAKSSLEYSIT